MAYPTEKQVTAWMAELRPSLDAPQSAFTQADAERVARLCFSVVQPSRKPSQASTAAVMGMLGRLAGHVIDTRTLVKNVTRIVANWGFIKEGMQIPDWDGTKTVSDSIVIGVSMPAVQMKRPSHVVAVKLKTGLCAGIIACGPMYDSALFGFLEHKAGTSKFSCAAEDVAGMRARVVASYVGGCFRVDSWDATESQKRHNRDLAVRRSDPAKCPAGATPCNVCPRNIRECPLAVWLPGPKTHEEATDNGG